VSVRIYIEGGGDQRAASAELRRGFAEFFRKVVPEKRQPKPIAGGSRHSTFDQFRIALARHKGDVVLLLVDAEGPVAEAATPWAHLKLHDGWDPPEGATDDQAHLMVQCMETWFLADKDALVSYYGQGFLTNALPRRHDIETIAKAEVFRVLERATKNTRTKGSYNKVAHAGSLLASVNPAKVCLASRHAWLLCAVLSRES
jgi:Domain of unknown function (DUF4276)